VELEEKPKLKEQEVEEEEKNRLEKEVEEKENMEPSRFLSSWNKELDNYMPRSGHQIFITHYFNTKMHRLDWRLFRKFVYG